MNPKPTVDAEELGGLGFNLVRRLLVILMVSVGAMVTIAGILSYHLVMDVSVDGNGAIETHRTLQVKSEVDGIVKEIRVGYGQLVDEGAVVAILDRRDVTARLLKIETDIKQNEGRRAAVEEAIRRDLGELEDDLILSELEVDGAQLNLDRIRMEQAMKQEDLVLPVGRSRRPIDELVPVREATIIVRQRVLDLERKRRRLAEESSRHHEVQALELTRRKLLEDKQLLEYQLHNSVIRAPLRGSVITSKPNSRLGDYVRAGEAILELDALEGWEARVVVDERDLPKIRLGHPARVFVEAYPHLEYRIFEGRVRKILSTPGPDGFSITLAISDPTISGDGDGYSLAHGMKARAQIVVERGRIAGLLWRRLLGGVERVSERAQAFGAYGKT